jgi:hypothetical protein
MFILSNQPYIFLTDKLIHFSAVHNEVTYRSLENFVPKSPLHQTYKNDLLESASYTQAGSFFPDWYLVNSLFISKNNILIYGYNRGYQCLGNNQQSEDGNI